MIEFTPPPPQICQLDRYIINITIAKSAVQAREVEFQSKHC
jgi:hypothetical protein